MGDLHEAVQSSNLKYKGRMAKNEKHGCIWTQMNQNLMSKHQLFCNSYYICLCGATLVACELWKVGYWEI